MEALRQDCTICHKPLTLYGSVAIKNGMLCRDCAKLCSPFLSEQEIHKMTAEEITQHLQYRSENNERLQQLKFDKLINGSLSLFVDDAKENILLTKRDDYVKENADIIPLKDIRDISVTRSYVADQQENVDINVRITLDNPQITNIKVRVNQFPNIVRESDDYKETVRKAAELKKALEDLTGGTYEQ